MVDNRCRAQLCSKLLRQVTHDERHDPSIMPWRHDHLMPRRSTEIKSMHPHITRVDQIGQVADGHHPTKRWQRHTQRAHHERKTRTCSKSAWSNGLQFADQSCGGGGSAVIDLNLIHTIEE